MRNDAYKRIIVKLKKYGFNFRSIYRVFSYYIIIIIRALSIINIIIYINISLLI